jgi:hypothetical protein
MEYGCLHKTLFNATERAKKNNNFNVDQMQFIEKKTPYDKIYNKLCKFILGIKKNVQAIFQPDMSWEDTQ